MRSTAVLFFLMISRCLFPSRGFCGRQIFEFPPPWWDGGRKMWIYGLLES